MGNLLGLGTKYVCGFFTWKSKMTSKMAAKTSSFLIIQIKQLKLDKNADFIMLVYSEVTGQA